MSRLKDFDNYCLFYHLIRHEAVQHFRPRQQPGYRRGRDVPAFEGTDRTSRRSKFTQNIH